MSLYLKMLEEANVQLHLEFNQILPPMGQNIKCGNSLIGSEYFSDQLLPDQEEVRRVNPFNWKGEFPEIFKSGGFDCVVGNPPYIRIQTMKEWAPVEVEIYKRSYEAASEGNYDIYVVFVEKGLSLLNDRGRLGFILPHKFFQAQFGKPIRNLISARKSIVEIVHFGAEQVFKNATTYTCLLFLANSPCESIRFVSVKSLANPNLLLEEVYNRIKSSEYNEKTLPEPAEREWHFSSDERILVLNKIKQQPQTLGDITRKIFVGLQTSADKIYVLRIIENKKNTVLAYSQSLEKEVEIEQGFVKPFLMGKDVHRYKPPQPRNVVIFPYSIKDGKAILMPDEFIQKNFPKGWKYLLENHSELAGREKGKMKGKEFYAYIYPKNLVEFDAVKVMTPEIALGPQMTFDETGGLYHTTKVYSFIFNENVKEDPKYFLGILNSKLLWLFLTSTGYVLRGGYFTFKTEYLKPFPIRLINFENLKEKNLHDQIVNFVNQILGLNIRLETIKSDQDKIVFQRQIDSLEIEINRIVFQLYGLNEAEIEILNSVDTHQEKRN